MSIHPTSASQKKNRLWPRALLLGAVVTLTAGLCRADDVPVSPSPSPTAPAPKAASKDLYLVGYAHLDTQWRWAYPQVIRNFIPDTMRHNFVLFEKYPHYIFNFSGSRRYEMMKEYYPEDYEKVRQYIKAGRWFPCGSSVDEGDCNVPSGESLIRQTLYGNRFFQREFGVTSREFMLPDCFGFTAALPSILSHCGIIGFSTQKLTWGSANGIPFKVGVWVGPDGRSVLAAFDPGAYVGEVKEDLSHSDSWLTRINNTGNLSGAYVDYHYFGTGDIGGAPAAKSVEWIEKSLTGDGPVHVISSRADDMFKAITTEQAGKLAHYQGELLLTQHSSGSITSQAYMKRWNRKNELLADAAERASVAAMWLGATPYPGKKLYDAWDLVLGSQMHDMLPGTSLPKAYEYCWNDELLAGQQFAAVTQDAVGAVTSAMDTSARGVALVVYNPLSIARQDVVEATVAFPSTVPAGIRVLGPDGSVAPSQVLSSQDGQVKLLFLAKVPSTGFATFDIQPSPSRVDTGTLKVSANSLENERFRVTVNEAGDIGSILDKSTGKEILQSPARLALLHENPSQFPAWNMDWKDRQNPPRAYVGGPATIRVAEAGPVRVALEVAREFEGSRYVQQIRLAASGERIEVSTTLDWQGKESCLKAAFPLAVGNPLATYDIQLGTVQRGNNEPKRYEVPQHQWIDLADPAGTSGTALLNDCKFGSDKPDDHTLRLTLVYTPGTAGGYVDQGTQDIGRHQMLYALAPHGGDWRQAQIPWQAARLNQPLLAFQCPSHPGPLGKSYSILQVSSPQVAVSALKKAEDGDEIIVRLRELDGQAAPNLTLTLPNSSILSAREVTGQEKDLAPATVRDGALVADVGPYQFRAFALKLAPPKTTLLAPTCESVALPFDTCATTSTRQLAAGGFDPNGRSFPAEQLPATIESGGISFKIGPTADGQKNALACHGQILAIPPADRLYVLAAAVGDVPARFVIGKSSVTCTVQDWTGYIGQWDNRLWEGPVPEMTFSQSNPYVGLVPGYAKPAEVAWYSSHLHHPTLGNEFYQYCYLFKYALDVPSGATTITLPDEPRIRIFAMTAARHTHDGSRPAQPLFDSFDDRANSAPVISPSTGTFNNATTVNLQHALYWNAGMMHYTLDGTMPTAASPPYSQPLTLSDTTTITAAEFDPQGRRGPVATAHLEIHDHTPPKVDAAEFLFDQPRARVRFSKPVFQAEAQTAANYTFTPALAVGSAVLDGEGRSVLLTLGAMPDADAHYRLTVGNIKDRSPAGNLISATAVDVLAMRHIFALASAPRGKSLTIPMSTLPLGAHDPFTLNLFCKVDQAPENRTIIAGFGHAEDTEDGVGRYLCKFANGIHFWSRSRDAETRTPLDVGTWQMLSVVYDGRHLTIYKNGARIGQRDLELGDDADRMIRIAPPDAWEHERVFQGAIRDLTIWNRALPEEILTGLWNAGKVGP